MFMRMNHTIDNIYYTEYWDIGDELIVCGSFHTIIKVCEILNCHGIMDFLVDFEVGFISKKSRYHEPLSL